ncbi:hypothetical protein CANCADRAFT_2396 [Tortispora caseinolytica NRRL Y-17796]|uniref:SMP-30/Gluconolactonase/LRE-like region domain-containing protein n=1 Tax=Tortispora caseinolytica NRRL Y-17796 TaxID=767744 RepID=A0A1E4TFW4_9ASCO|nr:hypothetical protein CANCADRAFT_2396 [Tortispora caseinolytica NRRL Y-17796]
MANIFVTPHCNLSESPIYDDRNNSFAWVDIPGLRAYYMPNMDDPSTYLTHEIKEKIGVLKLTNKPGIYISGAKRGIAMIDLMAANPELQYLKYFYEDPAKEEIMRANDGNVDRRGRLLVGTMNDNNENSPDGSLFSYDHTKDELKVLANGYYIPNGIVWNNASDAMYQIDSIVRTIYKFDYDIDTGDALNRRNFVVFPDDGSVPDGMTIDSNENLWVAKFNGGMVQQIDLNGNFLRSINIGPPRITCVTFASKELNKLIVTTANTQDGSEDNGGELFIIDMDESTGYTQNVFEESSLVH